MVECILGLWISLLIVLPTNCNWGQVKDPEEAKGPDPLTMSLTHVLMYI